MVRLARVVLPGVVHDVTQRGNRRLPIFFHDEDRHLYLALLRDGCDRARVSCLAWCLMDNHVHLLLVPEREDGLRAALAEAHRRYTRHVNFREGWRGHLFQSRFASYPVDDAHLLAAIRYVENNPVAVAMRPEAGGPETKGEAVADTIESRLRTGRPLGADGATAGPLAGPAKARPKPKRAN